MLARVARMKERDMNLPNSYFQLAGIHGYPFIEWAKRNSTVDKSRRYGYCTHSQVLFPTWHRIYALAYEARPFITPHKLLMADTLGA